MKYGRVGFKRIAVELFALAAVAIAGAGITLAGNGKPAAEGQAAKDLGKLNKEGASFVKISKDPGAYATEPPPLTVTQCGQCHPGYFQDIKQNGGRHTFNCQNCHKTFHSYSPRKNNWDAIMPKCSDCHNAPSVPHMERFQVCSECHTNPHSIAKLPMTPKLLNSCVVCHVGPPEQLKSYPSKHTNLMCNDCHTAHGLIPACSMCHKPHYEGQEFKTCASECHPVHMPKQIRYAKDVGARTCGACHDKVYATWTKTPSRHRKVNCAACHTKHGYIPQCSECHDLPHSKQLHERFPKCLTCHQDPHNPPVRQR